MPLTATTTSTTDNHNNNIDNFHSIQANNDIKQLLIESKMRCGGCGSKVGSQILTRALRKVKQYYPDDNAQMEANGVLNTIGDGLFSVICFK